MPQYDRTAEYQDRSSSPLDRIFKGALGVGAVAVPLFLARKPIVKGIGALMRNRAEGRIIAHSALDLVKDFTSTFEPMTRSISRAAAWGEGRAAHAFATEQLKGGGFDLLNKAKISSISEREARALHRVFNGSNGYNRFIDLDLTKWHPGIARDDVYNVAFVNRIAEEKDLHRIHSLLSANPLRDDNSAGHKYHDKLVRELGTLVVDPNIASRGQDLAEKIRSTTRDFIKNDAGFAMPDRSGKSTLLQRAQWALEDSLGLRTASVEDVLSSEQARRLANATSKAERDAIEKQFAESRKYYGDTFGDKDALHQVRAGRGVYLDSDDNVVSFDELWKATTEKIHWMDQNFKIPIASVYPSRMMPWVPRKRQGRIQMFMGAAEGQFGYAGVGDGLVTVGGHAFTAGFSDTGAAVTETVQGQFIAAERHGFFGRLQQGAAADDFASPADWMLSKQATPSAFAEMASVVTKNRDTNFAPTGWAALQDAILNPNSKNLHLLETSNVRQILRNSTDHLNELGLAEVSNYDQMIHRAFGETLSPELSEKLAEAGAGSNPELRRAILDDLAEKYKVNPDGSLADNVGLTSMLSEWYGTGSKDQSTVQVATNHIMGIGLEGMRFKAVGQDEIFYQKLGKAAARQTMLVSSEFSQAANISAAAEFLQSNPELSDISRSLYQGELIESFLGGRLTKTDLSTGNLNPLAAFGSEVPFVRGIFGDLGEGSTLNSVFEKNSISDLFEKTRRSSYLQPNLTDELAGSNSDPLLIRKGRGLRGLFAGSGDPENFSTSSLFSNFILERLNPMASKIGLGLSPNDIAKGPLGFAAAITFKRVMPLAGIGYGVSYLNYLSEKGDKPGEEGWSGLYDTFQTARSTLAKGWIAAETVTGIRAAKRFVANRVVGYEQFTELPFVGGLFDTRSISEYNEWLDKGYSKVRQGRWWTGGSRTPVIGGRIKAWLPNAQRRAWSDWQEAGTGFTPEQFWDQAPIPTPNNLLAPINHYWRNYRFEDLHKEDRPYAVSSGAFTERSWIGSLLNATVGRILKPRRFHENFDPYTGMDKREIQAAQDYLAGKPVDPRFAQGNMILESLRDGEVSISNQGGGGGLGLLKSIAQLGNLTGPIDQDALAATGTGVWREGQTVGSEVPAQIIVDKHGYTRYLVGSKSYSAGQVMLGSAGAGLARTGMVDPAYPTPGDLGINVPKFYGSSFGPPGIAPAVAAEQGLGSYLIQRLFGPVRNQAVGLPVPGIDTPQSRLQRYLSDEEIPGSRKLYNKTVTIAGQARNAEDFRYHANYASKSVEDIAGIYGFITSSMLEKVGINRDDLYNEYELATPEDAVSPAESYWRSELGGIPGETWGSELGRRFVPRRSGQQRLWNPLRNQMPGWLPGPKDYQDFLHGDPMTRVMGAEYLLPGAARDAVFGAPDLSISHPYGHMLGLNTDEAVQAILAQSKYSDPDSENDATKEGRAIHAAFQNIYKKQGRLIAAEQHIRVDDITGLVDAVIKTSGGPMPVEIKTKTTKAVQNLQAPEEQHISQLNLYLEALSAPKGAIYYTSREDPSISKVFYINHDHERFAREVGALRQAQGKVRDMLASGEVTQPELYTEFEKFRTLALVSPFSDQYRFLDRKMQKDYKGGNLDDGQWKEYLQLRDMVKERAVKKQMYHYQYSGSGSQTTRGVIEEVVGPGRFKLRGDERVYQLAGIDLDILNVEAKKNVPPEEEDRRAAAQKALDELGIVKGSRVKVVSDGLTHLASRGKEVVDASTYVNGVNVSRALIDRGMARKREEWTVGDRDVAGRRWNLIGWLGEQIAHLDTPINTFLWNVRSPGEEWDRTYMFGGGYGRWENFLRDYGRSAIWSFMGDNPLSAGLRGAMIGSMITPFLEWRNLHSAVSSTIGMKSTKEKLAKGFMKFLIPYKARQARTVAGKVWHSLSGARIGAMLGVGFSIAATLGLAGTKMGDDYVPTERKKQYDIEEYWDKIKYVKHKVFSRMYMKQGIEREGQILKLILNQIPAGVRREVWNLYERKRALWERNPRDPELKKINTRISRLTQTKTADRLGKELEMANLHEAVARRTAYGADPKQLSEVLGGMPAYARQVLIAGSKSKDDRDRIWKTLPNYLRESMWKLYGKDKVEKQDVKEYFGKHSLPGADWAGWKEEADVNDLRSLYIGDNAPGMSPLEMGVWPQILRETKERVGNIPMPRMQTSNSARDVRMTIRDLFSRVGYDVANVTLSPGAGQVNVRVKQDQTQEVVNYL